MVEGVVGAHRPHEANKGPPLDHAAHHRPRRACILREVRYRLVDGTEARAAQKFGPPPRGKTDVEHQRVAVVVSAAVQQREVLLHSASHVVSALCQRAIIVEIGECGQSDVVFGAQAIAHKFESGAVNGALSIAVGDDDVAVVDNGLFCALVALQIAVAQKEMRIALAVAEVDAKRL